nr:hypothetical protein [Patescibacteria group bacterium]
AVSGFLIENKKYKKFINPQYLKFTFYKLAFINHKNISSNIESVDFLPGGFMLAKTKVLLELGGWDTNFLYPFYNEDTDITYRIKRAGYKLGFTNHSRAFHLKAKGGVRKNLDKNFFYAFGFNNSYHYIKNFGFFYYFLYSIFTLSDVFFVLRQFNLYYIVEYIKGIIYGVKKAKNFSIASKL